MCGHYINTDCICAPFTGCGNSECVKNSNLGGNNNNQQVVRSDRLEIVGLFTAQSQNTNNQQTSVDNTRATAAFFCGVGLGRDGGGGGQNTNTADGTDSGEGILVRTAGPFVLRCGLYLIPFLAKHIGTLRIIPMLLHLKLI